MMSHLRQILLLSIITNFVFADAVKDTNAETAVGDAIGCGQQNTQLLTILDLMMEMWELHHLVKEQSEKIEKKIDELDSKLSGHGGISDMMESKLVEVIGQVESRLIGKMDDLESYFTLNISEVRSDVSKIENKIDVWRSEVRLVSQHKLTWQNETLENYFSDFAVDGVYTLSGAKDGVNPIQHMAGNTANYMLIIELGGLFKIHSVKIWNRIDCCQNRLGVLIYADDEFLGSISVAQRQYNFFAKKNVYARNIYLKQTTSRHMNYVEVQVFGTGPYNEDELNGLKN